MQKSGVQKFSLEPLHLAPIKNGTVFILNAISSGMQRGLKTQLKSEIEKFSKKYGCDINHDFYVTLGPFDNMIRLDVDDFSIINPLSYMSGVNTQQIQCVYKIWENSNDMTPKAFFCLTQLKIQNYLIIGSGPVIETMIARLIVQKIKKEFPEGTKLEIFGTLGWEEIMVFASNNTGFHSLFHPMEAVVRRLSLKDLDDEVLSDSGYRIGTTEKSVDYSKKHLFLSSYSTAGYRLDLANRIEGYLKSKSEEMETANPIIHYSDLSNERIDSIFDELGVTGTDKEVFVSSRLSIKPGHTEKIRKLIREIFRGTDLLDQMNDYKALERFIIGRYDIYTLLTKQISSREFILIFELVRYTLSGNLCRDDEYHEFLKKSQYYSSFTILSIRTESENTKNAASKDGFNSEGLFVQQFDKLKLSNYNNKSIHDCFQQDQPEAWLYKTIPDAMIISLSRIFALFDSCILDRFTCESFLDMYSYMRKLREFIETIRIHDGSIYYGPKDQPVFLGKFNPKEPDALSVFLTSKLYDAINHFNTGYVQRFISSYPMMDKTELGVDFSGRLHRILSAITGMQNLLVKDLRCGEGEGFACIRPYPFVRVDVSGFDVVETNVFSLLQIETNHVVFHEIPHYLDRNKEHFDFFNKMIELISKQASSFIPAQFFQINLRYLFEELVSDLIHYFFCFNNPAMHRFFFWLRLLNCKSPLDANIVFRFCMFRSIIETDSTDQMIGLLEIRDLKSAIESLCCISELPKNVQMSLQQLIDELVQCHVSEEQHFIAMLVTCIRLASKLADPILMQIKKNKIPLVEDDSIFPPSESIKPLLPMNFDGHSLAASVHIFHEILNFVYSNREHLNLSGDGIVNFVKNTDLRQRLFCYRIALINTMFWESLEWKRKLIEKSDISAPIWITNN